MEKIIKHSMVLLASFFAFASLLPGLLYFKILYMIQAAIIIIRWHHFYIPSLKLGCYLSTFVTLIAMKFSSNLNVDTIFIITLFLYKLEYRNSVYLFIIFPTIYAALSVISADQSYYSYIAFTIAVIATFKITEILKNIYEKHIHDMDDLKSKLTLLNHRKDLIFEGAGTGVWEWPKIKNTKMVWNKSIKHLLEYDHENLQANFKTVLRIIHPEDKEKLFTLIRSNGLKENSFKFELRLKTHYSGFQWFHCQGIFSRNSFSTGPVIGGLYNIQDRLHLQGQEMRLLNIIETSRDLIAILDSSGHIQYANSCLKRVFKILFEQNPTPHIKNLYSNEEQVKHILEILPFVKREGIWKGEKILSTPKTSNIPQDQIIPVEQTILYHQSDEHGQNEYFSTIIRDITEIKLYEKNIKDEMNKALIATNQMEEFLSKMAHEVRTPLNTLMGMSELLLATDLSHEQRIYSTKINIKAEILHALVTAVLDLSLLENNQYHIELVPFNINEILEQIKTLFSEQMEKKNLQYRETINITCNQICADPSTLKKVLIHLLTNSIKFTQKGGIELKVRERKNTFEFTIDDTGIGTSEKDWEKLFDPFTQGPSEVHKLYGGAGIGLGLSKKMIEIMGGTIKIVPKLTPGFRIVFEIPVEKIQTDVEKVTVGEDANKDKPTGHILIVDDDESNRTLLIHFLKNTPYTYEEALNGQQAFDRISKQANTPEKPRIQLICMDLMMPVLDGLEATRLIREWEKDNNQNEIPILGITATTLQEKIHQCLEGGYTQMLTKPINRKVFKEAVKKLILIE